MAILLVSIGLLGIAGLSGATFGYNKASQLRLSGMVLVNDYADRARVNIYGYDLRQYNIHLSDPSASPRVDPTYAPNLDTSTDANAATAANTVAAADREDFLNAVADRLPGGDAVVVSSPSANARDMDVWILWIEPSANGDPLENAASSLFNAAQGNCPSTLTAAERDVYSCMYFKVDL